jgi:hypothetical protein
MKICKAIITESKTYPDQVSLRGTDIRSIRKTLTDAGFEPGDEIVIVLKSEWEETKTKERQNEKLPMV